MDSYGIFTGQCSAENPATGGAKQIVDRAGIYNVNVTSRGRGSVVKDGTAGRRRGANVTATLNASAACAPNDVDGRDPHRPPSTALTTWNVDDFNKGFLTRRARRSTPGCRTAPGTSAPTTAAPQDGDRDVEQHGDDHDPALVTIDVNSTGSTTGRCP